jgi:hypothetical protein
MNAVAQGAVLMTPNQLQEVAERVVRRARQQGYIVPREVREELAQASLSESLWKEVLALALPSLSYRHGRYHYRTPAGAPLATAEPRLTIESAVHLLLEQHHASTTAVERREQERVDFVQPVKVITEDNREFTLLSRDLSATGIRMVGTQRLLGQKVRVQIPIPDNPPVEFLVRILWTCLVGGDLVENGGCFCR